MTLLINMMTAIHHRLSHCFTIEARTAKFHSARRSPRPIIRPNGPGPDGKGANDCIYFNIPVNPADPAGSHTINVNRRQLPNITDGAHYRRHNRSSTFTARPLSNLTERTPVAAIGINIRCPYNIIRGLVINRFSRDGIWIQTVTTQSSAVTSALMLRARLRRPNGWTYEGQEHALLWHTCGRELDTSAEQLPRIGTSLPAMHVDGILGQRQQQHHHRQLH